jgi:hypothetical protein
VLNATVVRGRARVRALWAAVWNPGSSGGVQVGMRRLVGCLALVSLLAACGSSGRASTPGSTSPTTGGNVTSTSFQEHPPRALRGVAVAKFACSDPSVQSDVSQVPIEGVEAFLLCPLGTPGQPSEAVSIRPNDPVFAVLVRALSASDLPSISGTVCPAYADLTQVVLARTTGGAYRVSIPTDACRHYQRDALDALNRARGFNGA